MKIKRILFLGHNKWATLTLRALVANGYEIVGVITETDEFDRREERTYERFSKFGAYESLKNVAEDLNIEVFQPDNVNSPKFIKNVLKRLSPQLAIIVSYHSILKRDFLNAVKTINVHGAPLPKYRGRAPINWAIINGENYTGVTVHHVVPRVDAGKIIEQRFIPISFRDRAIDVLLRTLPVYPEITLSAVKKLENNINYGIEQDNSESLYFPRRFPENGYIYWKYEKTVDIYNKIRALSYPYPCARAIYEDKTILINSCSIASEKRISPVTGIIVRTDKTGVYVTTIDGLIRIETLINGKEKEILASSLLKIGRKLS